MFSYVYCCCDQQLLYDDVADDVVVVVVDDDVLWLYCDYLRHLDLQLLLQQQRLQQQQSMRPIQFAVILNFSRVCCDDDKFVEFAVVAVVVGRLPNYWHVAVLAVDSMR